MVMTATKQKPADMGAFADMLEMVTCVRHWNDKLFSFRITRPSSLRFRSGEFVMIGLMGDNGRPILRAYSIASPVWDSELEFFSIKVEDGPLTSRLQRIEVGDWIILKAKPTGTLVNDALIGGKRLYLLSTGTGIAPFASIVRDPETYEKFDEIVLTHTCRRVSDLDYGFEIMNRTMFDPLVGEEAAKKLKHYPTTTREHSDHDGRITTLIENGQLFSDLGLPDLNPETDRIMICGSMAFNMDLKTICLERGFVEGSNSRPGSFVLEKAFVGE